MRHLRFFDAFDISLFSVRPSFITGTTIRSARSVSQKNMKRWKPCKLYFSRYTHFKIHSVLRSKYSQFYSLNCWNEWNIKWPFHLSKFWIQSVLCTFQKVLELVLERVPFLVPERTRTIGTKSGRSTRSKIWKSFRNGMRDYLIVCIFQIMCIML